MSEKAAFVVKIFRNEPTIERCIASVLNQTYSNLEFYVICGKDTVDIIKSYAETDERIIVKYTENYNRAFLCGIFEEIRCKNIDYYVWVDGDDWYETDFLERTIAYANSENVDIVFCGYNEIDIQGNCKEKYCVENAWSCETKNTEQWFVDGWRYLSTTWSVLYKVGVLSCFREDSLPEAESHGFRGSDTMFNYSILPYAKRIGFLDYCGYNYQITDASETCQIHPNRKYAPVVLLNYIQKFIESNNSEDFISIYYLYTQYGEIILSEIALILNSNLAIEEKFQYIKFVLCQEKTYGLYNLTIRTRRDQFQDKFLNAVFLCEHIFSEEQLAEIVKIIYPQIEFIIDEKKITYANIERIRLAKNRLIDLILETI